MSPDHRKLNSLTDMNPDMNFALGLLSELLSRITFGHVCHFVSVVAACYSLFVNIQLRNVVQRLEAEMAIIRPAERRTDVRIGIESLAALREIADNVRAMQGGPPRAKQEASREPPRARGVEAGAREEGRASAEGSIVTSESLRSEKAAKALQDLTQKQWGEFEPEEVDW